MARWSFLLVTESLLPSENDLLTFGTLSNGEDDSILAALIQFAFIFVEIYSS